MLTNSFASNSQTSRPPSTGAHSLVTPIEQEPPPPFSEQYGEVDFNQDGFGGQAKVASKGITPD